MLKAFIPFGNQLTQILRLKSLPFIIIGVGIAVRFCQYVFAKSLWLDESLLALNIVNKSFPEFLKPLDYHQVAPVGFLFIEKLFVQLLGNNEYALRLFPFICGTISLFLFFKIAKHLLEKEAFLIVLTLFSFSGYLINYSAEAKQYSTDVTIILFLYATTVHFQSKRLKINHIASFGIIGAITIWFSHPSAFVLAGIGICLSLFSLKRKDWRRISQLSIVYIIWLFSFAAFYMITFHDFQNTTSTGNIETMQNAWTGCFTPFPPTSLSDIRWFVRTFFSIFKNPIGLHYVGIAVLTFITGCTSLFSKNKRWFFLLLSPVLITLIVSGFHLYPFGYRLLLFIVPLVLLFIAEGAESIVSKTKDSFPMIGIILLCLLLAQPTLKAAYNLMTQNIYRVRPIEDIKPVMNYLKKEKHEEDIIYLYHGSNIAFQYYAKQCGFDDDDYIIGIKARGALENYTKDLDKLRGNKRVWLLFTHVTKSAGVDEEKFFLYYLDSIGKRINHFKSEGAAIYLYDLNRIEFER